MKTDIIDVLCFMLVGFFVISSLDPTPVEKSTKICEVKQQIMLKTCCKATKSLL